jgi:hypothetical protein
MKVTVKHISPKNPLWVVLEPAGIQSGIVKLKAEGAWAELSEETTVGTELTIDAKARIVKGFWVV